MRSSFRIFSKCALLTALSVGQLTGCFGGSSDQPTVENQQAGSLILPLQAVGQSGNVYRLRNAFFDIFNLQTGESILLSSEDFVSSFEVTTQLVRGDYNITLLDGWRMEQVTGSGGSGGSGGFGGGSPAGAAGAEAGGVAGEFVDPFPVPAGGRVITPPPRPVPVPVPLPPIIDEGSAGDPGIAGAAPEPEGGTVGFGGASGIAGGISRGGAIGKGGTVGVSGFTGTAGKDPTGGAPNSGVFVEALLLSPASQFFTIVARQDSFVNFQFAVGKDVIRMNPGTLHIGFTVDEQCVRPPGAFDPNRVLLEHNRDAMQQVALRDVFTALATNDGRSADPVRLYQEVIDSFASKARGRLPDAIHCGDESVDGSPSLNGFPLVCDRTEAGQIDNIDTWKPLAFVNRMDLAPQNGAHCGQQRMIFSTNAQNRMFMIFESQIPNPNPELGIQGCVPLAKFWSEANGMTDVKARGARLVQAFLKGDPGLSSQGFGPFMTATNLTVGSGQIRTNSFDSSPWTLREFKLAIEEQRLAAIPFPVAEAPNGDLWDENVPLAQGPSCRESFIQAAQGLLVNNPSDMSFVVDQACKDAESQNNGSQNYAFRMSPGFRQTLQDAFAGTGLRAEDIATRAQFAGS
ncbi:MAG TPA: hypothetical protein VFQ61_36985, partial [Polyangiaceae bacterium]|nr:hypothetical protein [Polyangiaceae bacterium]